MSQYNILEMESLRIENDNTAIRDWLYYKIMIGVFGILSIITLLVFLRYARMLFARFGTVNKAQKWFLVFLTLSYLSNIAFAAHEIIGRMICWQDPPVCTTMVFSWLNFVIYMTAVIFNIYGWVFQIMKLHAFMKGSQPYTKTYWWLLVLTLLTIYSIFIVFIIHGWMVEDEPVLVISSFGYTLSVIYILVGAGYPIVGYLLYRKVSQAGKPEIARMMRNKMIINCMFIFIIFLFRGIFIFLRSFNDFIIAFRKQGLYNNGIWYAIYTFGYFTTVWIIPTFSQIYMLRFLSKIKASLERDSLKSMKSVERKFSFQQNDEPSVSTIMPEPSFSINEVFNQKLLQNQD